MKRRRLLRPTPDLDAQADCLRMSKGKCPRVLVSFGACSRNNPRCANVALILCCAGDVSGDPPPRHSAACARPPA
jgi:hypothetical protein